MVTANRLWSQVFGVAFSNKRWLHFFMLVGPAAGLWAVLGGLLQMSGSRSRRSCSAGSSILRYLMPIGEILNPWDAFLYPRRTVAHRYYIVGLGKTNIREASQTQAFTLLVPVQLATCTTAGSSCREYIARVTLSLPWCSSRYDEGGWLHWHWS